MKNIKTLKLVGVFMTLTFLLTVPTFRTMAEEKIDENQKVEADMEATIEIDSENADVIKDREAMELDEDYNSPRSNRLQGENEEEFLEGDYNSSRSNKPSTEINLDPDDGGDGIDDLREDDVTILDQENSVRERNKRGEAFIIDRDRENVTDLADVDAVCGQSKGAAMDEEGEVYCWGSGFSVRAESGSGGGAGKVSMTDIDFKSVRDWSDEEKDSLRDFGRNVAEDKKEGKLAQIIIDNMEDERIESVKIDEGSGSVKYRARFKLFGFIPLEREVEAVVEDGKERINYPWYGIISRKPDGSKISNILSNLQDLI